MKQTSSYEVELKRALVAGIARRSERHRRMRRFAVILVVPSVILLSIGVATGTLRWPEPSDVPPGTEPSPLGPEVVLAQGDFGKLPWVLSAFDSDKGMCVHLETATSKSGSCGQIANGSAVFYNTVSFRTPGVDVIFGAVSLEARSVRLLLTDGSTREVELIRSRRLDAAFFVTSTAVGVGQVVAYDASGEKLP